MSEGGWFLKLSNELVCAQKKLAAFSHIHSGVPSPTIPYHSAYLAHTQSHMLLTWSPSLRWLSIPPEGIL